MGEDRARGDARIGIIMRRSHINVLEDQNLKNLNVLEEDILLKNNP